jgi:hypothetical protein
MGSQMNERVRELVEQAGARELGADLYGAEFIGAIRLDFLEKFAELLIGDCAEVAGCNVHVSGFALGDLIKQHFGVEE